MERGAVTRLSTASRNTTQVCPAAEANGSRDGHDARRAAGGTQAEADGVHSAVLMGGDAVTPSSPERGNTIQARPSAAEANGSGEGYGCDGASRVGVDSPIEPWKEATRGRAFETAKLASDLVGASILLIMLSPVMLLIATAIRLESAGPALFGQKRTGLHGRRFTLYKFRTMRVGAENERARLAHLSHLALPAFKIRDDPRVTRVGAILRAWSLDEIPNLFNVLLRNMSLVGPRPNSWGPETYEDWQLPRLSVRPGMTGLAQVGGRCDLQFPEQVRLDIRYIRERSLWLDVRILGRTILAVLSRRGAY